MIVGLTLLPYIFNLVRVTRPIRNEYLMQFSYTYNSQGGKGTKVDVYLPYRGAISFYVYIVPSGLISIFQDVVCDKISCGLQPTRFFLNFL